MCFPIVVWCEIEVMTATCSEFGFSAVHSANFFCHYISEDDFALFQSDSERMCVCLVTMNFFHTQQWKMICSDQQWPKRLQINDYRINQVVVFTDTSH